MRRCIYRRDRPKSFGFCRVFLTSHTRTQNIRRTNLHTRQKHAAGLFYPITMRQANNSKLKPLLNWCDRLLQKTVLSVSTKRSEINSCFIVTELQTATNARDANALRSIIRHAENVNFTLLLPKEVDTAQQLLNSLERIQALKEAVLKLDQKTMLELRNYSKPPELVHQVIKATLLLLGYDITLTTVSNNTSLGFFFRFTLRIERSRT